MKILSAVTKQSTDTIDAVTQKGLSALWTQSSNTDFSLDILTVCSISP